MADQIGGTPAPAGTSEPAATPAAAPVATAPATAAAEPALAATSAEPSTPAGDPAPPAPKDWATLRTEYSKGDDKIEKRLARYSSPEAVLDALVAAQNKIASGALKSALPDKATPEELAAWRVDNGIPAKPEDYDTTLPKGLVIGEADKPVIEGFLKTAHSKNMSPDQVKETLNWYYQEQERQLDARNAKDTEFKSQSEDKLRAEWGGEYKLNINMIGGLLDTAPAGVKDLVVSARLGDGTPLGNHPEVLRWLANLTALLTEQCSRSRQTSGLGQL